MKKAVLPAVMYIVFYLLSLVLISLSVLIYQMITDYSPVFMSLSLIFSKLPGILMQVIPTATAVSLILVLLARIRHRGRNLVGSLLIIIIASGLYTFPFLFFGRLTSGDIETQRFPFYEQRLTQIEETIVYIERIEAGTPGANGIPGAGTVSDANIEANGTPGAGTDTTEGGAGAGNTPDAFPIRGVSILHLGGRAPRIDYYPMSIADPGEQTLSTSPSDEEGQRVYMDYTDHQSFSGFSITPPFFLDTMFREISALSRALSENLNRGLFPFFLNAIAQVLFLVGSWSLIRTSRWPLWNGIFALIFLRGFFFLDSLFRGETVLEGMKLLTIDEYHRYAAPAIFIFLFVLFVMWGFFFTKSEADLEAAG